MQGQVFLLRLWVIKLSIVLLILMLDAIGVSTMFTKHLLVVLRSRGNMWLSRCRVGWLGIVSSNGAVMGLSRRNEMPSSGCGSSGMLSMHSYFMHCYWGNWVSLDPDNLSMVRWMIMKHYLFVIVHMMW